MSSRHIIISSRDRGVRELSGVSFMRALIPFMRAQSSGSNPLAKTPPPLIIALGIRIPIRESKRDIAFKS